MRVLNKNVDKIRATTARKFSAVSRISDQKTEQLTKKPQAQLDAQKSSALTVDIQSLSTKQVALKIASVLRFIFHYFHSRSKINYQPRREQKTVFLGSVLRTQTERILTN